MTSSPVLSEVNSSGWIVEQAWQELDHTWTASIKRWDRPGLFTKYCHGQSLEEALSKALQAGQELLAFRTVIEKSTEPEQLTLEDLDI